MQMYAIWVQVCVCVGVYVCASYLLSDKLSYEVACNH